MHSNTRKAVMKPKQTNKHIYIGNRFEKCLNGQTQFDTQSYADLGNCFRVLNFLASLFNGIKNCFNGDFGSSGDSNELGIEVCINTLDTFESVQGTSNGTRAAWNSLKWLE